MTKKPTHLHWSIEIDQICQAKALQPNAKCPALGSSCLAEGLAARTGRAENGGKLLTVWGCQMACCHSVLRWMILDPKRIPNVWFTESRLLFRNVGKHSHHRYINIYHRYIYHKHTNSWSYNPTNPLFAKARGPSVGALAPSRFFKSLLEALLMSQAQAVTWMRRGKP